jgi:hypothetical protein
VANSSIFADEWRECLQEQYKSVVRNNDQITLKTLVGVMHDVGFSEADLRDLAFQATLRAEDVADDFVPDMAIMSGAVQGVTLDAAPEAAPSAADAPVEEAPLPESVVETLIEEVTTPDDIGETLEDTLTAIAEEPPLDAGLLVLSGVATEAELDASLAVAESIEENGTDSEGDDTAEPDEPEPKLPPGVQQLSLF